MVAVCMAAGRRGKRRYRVDVAHGFNCHKALPLAPTLQCLSNAFMTSLPCNASWRGAMLVWEVP